MGDEIARIELLRQNVQAEKKSPEQIHAEKDVEKPDVWHEKRSTGKNCPNCGRPLCEGILHFWGTTRIFRITCQCVIDKQKADAELDKQAKRRRYIADLRRNSGLPRKWENVAFESFEPRKGTERAYKACINYAEQFPSLQSRGIGMYLYGTGGSGKSRLAASIANKLLDKGVPLKWWNVTSLYLAIQATFSGQGSSQRIIDGCTNVGLLILDDMGAEKPSEWTMTTMYDIINTRIDNVLPTIVTSNLTLDELAKKADSRVMSRLNDKDVFPHIVNSATDYRRERK